MKLARSVVAFAALALAGCPSPRPREVDDSVDPNLNLRWAWPLACKGSSAECNAAVPLEHLHAATAACVQGTCVATACAADHLDCGPDWGCETQQSTEHCGTCGRACRWSSCIAGACNEPVQIAAGEEHTCAVRASGAVVCWGGNMSGELGNGTVDPSNAPSAVSGVTDAVEIAAGGGHTCARRRAGDVVCWGYGDDGQLGDGRTTHAECAEGLGCSRTPVAVAGLSDAIELAAGGHHTCARRASGAVACWGGGLSGELGDGTTEQRLVPVAVSGLDDAVELAAGESHTCARRASGAGACWGDNTFGQLGDGTTERRLVPVAVSGLDDAVELAAGGAQTCARRASGAVACWGSGKLGQLGNGSTTVAQTTPVAVAGLPDAVAISVGARHGCAIRASGERADSKGLVVCWGDNTDAQLGAPTGATCVDGFGAARDCSPTPVAVAGLPGLYDDALEITAGARHTCARRSQSFRAFACWGSGVLGTSYPRSLAPADVSAPR
ncbi:MAG: hypothetical protein IT373_05160 [Polyangiaceae bacterium]|nr:hypothetical protein [Polyangiaceae bacterium]